jgi:hypothetical protein
MRVLHESLHESGGGAEAEELDFVFVFRQPFRCDTASTFNPANTTTRGRGVCTYGTGIYSRACTGGCLSGRHGYIYMLNCDTYNIFNGYLLR